MALLNELMGRALPMVGAEGESSNPGSEMAATAEEDNEAVNLQAELENVSKMMDAAKRGLGLANRLTGPSKKQHMGRVLGNMNRIRSQLRRVEKEIEASMERSGHGDTAGGPAPGEMEQY